MLRHNIAKRTLPNTTWHLLLGGRFAPMFVFHRKSVVSLSRCTPTCLALHKILKTGVCPTCMQALHKILKQEYEGFFLPPLPDKNFIDGHIARESFLRLRRADLQVCICIFICRFMATLRAFIFIFYIYILSVD